MKDQHTQKPGSDQLPVCKEKLGSVNAHRRTAVFGAIAGASATAVWHKPIIQSIVLPAHAQTSTTVTFFAASAVVTPITKSDWLLDAVIPSAYAGVEPISSSEFSAAIEQPVAGVDSYEVSIFERILEGETNAGEVLYSGTASEASGGTIAVVDNPCMLEIGSIDASIDSVSMSEVTISLNNRGVSLTIPAGSGSLPMPMCVVAPLPAAFFNPAAPAVPIGDVSQHSILDLFISSAHAGDGPGPDDVFGVSAEKNDEESYTVSHLNVEGNVLRRGVLQVPADPSGVSGPGPDGSLDFITNACDDLKDGGPASITARILSVDNAEMVIQIETRSSDRIDLVLPEGAGMLEPICTPR
jgi:hypothetical protein